MHSLRIFAAVLFSIILSAGMGLALTDSWHIETVDNTGDAGEYTSMKLASSDNPHISYYDVTNQHLKYAHWDGSSWNIATVDSAGGVGSGTSLDLDSSGNPYISYYDQGNGYLKLAYWNGSTWNISTVDNSANVGLYNSIALDSSNNPSIAYYDSTNKVLKLAQWGGSSWTISVIDNAADVGQYCSIGLDRTLGYVHISYYDATNGDLKYLHWTGTEWHIFSLDTAGDVGTNTSLAMDSEGKVHISYFDQTYEYLKYATDLTGPWDISAVHQIGEFTDTSLALDANTTPYIAFFDMSNYTLYQARLVDTTWEISQVDSSNWVGMYNSIAIDSSNRPHISYYDTTNHALKYAWYGPDVGIDLTAFSAVAKDNAVLLSWSVECTQGEQIAGFNLYRREIVTDSAPCVAESYSSPLQKQDALWTKVNSSLITGQNPYSYTDSPANGGDYPANGGEGGEYKLEAVLADESAETLGTTQVTTQQPTTFTIVNLYPNPASETVTCLLSVPNAGSIDLKLYDLSGRIVLEKQIIVSEPNEMSAVLDVSSLASGVYTLQATCGGSGASAKCVVAR
jgi:hypothetical protein